MPSEAPPVKEPARRPVRRSAQPPRKPAKRKKRSRARATFSERLRDRIDHGKEWLEAAAIELRGASTALMLWKKFGFTGLLIVFLIVGGPLGEYSVISRFVNATLPQTAGDFGVRFEAADWSYHPLSLRAVARDVTIRPAHANNNVAPVFTAGEVEFQGTLSSMAAGFYELITGRWVHTFNEIDIRHAHLQIERSMTGDLNWTEYVEAVPSERRTEIGSGAYRINGVSIQDLKISFVEHLPGPSGAGIIGTTQASIFVDAISGSITEIKPMPGTDDLPTRLSLDGRSAEGTLAVRGKLGLAQVIANSPNPGPYYDVTIALANIGMGAYATMVPATRVVPSRGNVHGRVRLVNLPSKTPAPCVSDLRATDVRYEPNPRLVTRPIEFNTLKQQATNFSASGPFDICLPARPPDPNAPGDLRYQRVTSASILASFNEQTTAGAPPALRQAVVQDTRSITNSLADAAVQDLTSDLVDRSSAELSKVLGPQSGAALQQALKPNGSTADSAVTKGVKSVGRGIKRLFGGGDKKK
jgi:hypothetical protein